MYDEEDMMYHILCFLKNSDEPEGAGSVGRYLRDRGFSVAEATAGRAMRHLDDRGFVEKRSNRGRVISQSGKEYLVSMNSQNMRTRQAEKLISTVIPTTMEQLKELMVARRAVELETARLAALNSSEENMAALRLLVDEQERCAAAGQPVSDTDTAFHCLIARAGENRVLEAIVTLLRQEHASAEGLEMVRRRSGRIYNPEHRRILEAIELRDPELAVLMMSRHLDGVLQSLEFSAA